jgi:DNA-binding response OmpR family regulator
VLLKASIHDYAVILLDRDLPVANGHEVCTQLAARRPEARILMLAPAAGVEERIRGLRLGADDYLSEPFDLRELVARVHALIRRSGRARAPVLRHGDVELDPARREVTRAGRRVPLQPKEFGVLLALLEADGAVVSAEDLLERVWDENVDPFTNVVRVVMMTLRGSRMGVRQQPVRSRRQHHRYDDDGRQHPDDHGDHDDDRRHHDERIGVNRIGPAQRAQARDPGAAPAPRIAAQ